MSDSVKLVAQLAFVPGSSSLAAATVRQTQAVQFALTNAGSLASYVYQVTAGTPKVVLFPAGPGSANSMALFVVDDAVNPQAVTFSATFVDTNSNTITQSQQVTATAPYLGPWCANSGYNTTITNNGSGTTTVRLFFWGN